LRRLSSSRPQAVNALASYRTIVAQVSTTFVIAPLSLTGSMAARTPSSISSILSPRIAGDDEENEGMRDARSPREMVCVVCTAIFLATSRHVSLKKAGTSFGWRPRVSGSAQRLRQPPHISSHGFCPSAALVEAQIRIAPPCLIGRSGMAFVRSGSIQCSARPIEMISNDPVARAVSRLPPRSGGAAAMGGRPPPLPVSVSLARQRPLSACQRKAQIRGQAIRTRYQARSIGTTA
jgi:hypothetical protein